MATAKIVFILLWMVFILPLIFFNIGKMYRKKEGEKPRLNIPVVTSIAILAILITLILLNTYNITIDYQPVLVADRFVNTLSTAEYEEAEKSFKKIVVNESIEDDINEIFSSVPEKGGRYQIGSIIRAKYFYDKEFFPSENVKENQSDVVCVMVRIDNNNPQYDYFIIRMRKTDKIKWRVDAVMRANEESVSYAKKYDLISTEHSGTWYKF